MSWKDALVNYAKTKDPLKLPREVLMLHNDYTITIFDKYPKAMFHALCLPRLPFVEHKSDMDVPQSTLNNLAALIASRHGLAVLKLLKEASLEVVETIEEEMLKQEGFKWPVSVGFHAIESMAHVHLHIISQDFVSECLKNKKHWNSFSPRHGFFLHLDDVIEWVEKGTLKQHNKSKSAYGKLLTDPLKCYECDETFTTIPKLKEHLVRDFKKRKEAASPVTGASTASKKRSSEVEAEEEDTSEDEDKKAKQPTKKKSKLA